MATYPKPYLDIPSQINAYMSAGLIIDSQPALEKALSDIGYYRLRGYCFHLYNQNLKQFSPNTHSTTILALCSFDMELAHLLSSMTAAIEISLRARLVEAFRVYGDPLALYDPSYSDDKENFWRNQSSIASEIARSRDVFILHHFNNHDGMIPLWAAVEVLSFGTLSKIISNLKTGTGTAFAQLLPNYHYVSAKGKTVCPSASAFSSWVHTVSFVRNVCAHNGRLYNRSFSVKPEIIDTDKIIPTPRFTALYQILLAMKYLAPDKSSWSHFSGDLIALIQKYQASIDLNRLGFPSDWQNHL